MSIARHHNEWLSLIEVSGPFIRLPIFLRVFPQGWMRSIKIRPPKRAWCMKNCFTVTSM